MTELRISPTLSLPLDAATETFGILAKKGAGKSNAAVVMAEEMWDADIPWVAIDPKGDWWGLRSSGDGEAPGLALPVFGSRHGDIPLEPGSGEMLADLILAKMLTCVLDVSEFTKAEQTRFLIAFADRLYRQARDEPLHLFLEEAHEYLPQRVMRDEARLVGAWQKIVKQGRFKGLGCTLVSQRSASLNKDVLTQVDTLIVLRTTSPQDRAAVKAWVDVHAESAEMLDTLPSLGDGEAWVWSPEFLHSLERIQFRRRRTFDSGATPKVGQARRTPATLADVDLDLIRGQMADTIERAKATDPKELAKRVKTLERDLANRPTETKVATVVERVEVPILSDHDRELIAKIDTTLSGLSGSIGWTRSVLEAIAERIDATIQDGQREADKPQPRVAPTPVPATSKPSAAPSNGETDLRAGARRIVDTVARHHPLTLTKTQVATLSNLKVTGGTFGNYWSQVKRAGLITERGGEVLITEAGLAYADVTDPDPMTTAEIIDMWRARLRKGAREMLDVLVDHYPEPMTREELALAVDMVASGGTFGNYLGTLRRNGLIETTDGEVVASETLFLSHV